MGGLDDRMLKMVLRMIPQSYIDSIPELIVKAVNDRIRAAEVNANEAAAVMIFPGDTDSRICIVGIDEADNIREIEKYSGNEFIRSLLKQTDNG